LWVPLTYIQPLLETEGKEKVEQIKNSSEHEFTEGAAVSLNQVLVIEGHAVEYHGGKR
jgi:hypothetical protein